MTVFKICDREIGPQCAPYIVAEMSANHGHDFDRAVGILRAAKKAGADAVKLQSYTSETMTIDCDNQYFRIKGTPWDGRRLFELYADAHTPWDWYRQLTPVANDLGLQLFSTPFDSTSVDYLEQEGAPAYKVASFEIVDLPLLSRVARTGKPVILSTGMASSVEIEEAVATLRAAGCRNYALLKCTSAYPAPATEMNLHTIPDLIQKFRVPVGISDHTMEVAVPVSAIALGACIVEKHLTLSRSQEGPDSSFSLEPDEFKLMVQAVRTAFESLGDIHYGATDRERSSLVFRRSLFVVKDIKAGEMFTNENVRSIRPGYGLPPRAFDQVLGRCANRSIKRGTPMSWDLITSSSETKS